MSDENEKRPKKGTPGLDEVLAVTQTIAQAVEGLIEEEVLAGEEADRVRSVFLMAMGTFYKINRDVQDAKTQRSLDHIVEFAVEELKKGEPITVSEDFDPPPDKSRMN